MSNAHTPISEDDLLSQHVRRIDLIEQCANEVSKAEFARKWRSLLTKCAAWFSSVPLSPDLYREPGGAFRCTVETAFYAMRLAGGQKFGTNLPSEKRRRIEPQYNYAVFLASISSRLDEPFQHFEIVRASDGQSWNPSIHGSTATFLGGQPYRVLRRDTPLPVERMRTGMLAQVLIGTELLAGLDAEVLTEMFGAINPNMNPIGAESLTHKVVRQAVSTAAEFDRKAQRGVFEPVKFEVPSAVHVAAQLEPTSVPASPGAGVSVSATASQPASLGKTTQVPRETKAGPAAVDPAPRKSMAAEPIVARSADACLEAPETVPAAATPANNRAAHAGSLLATMQADEAPAHNLAPTTEKEATGPATIDPARLQSLAAKPAPPAAFDDVLKGAPNMILELFRALREDVAAGKAKVEWGAQGLRVPKRLVGSYGVASDTLVEHMRKRSLLVGNGSTEITLAPRAGELLLERPA